MSKSFINSVDERTKLAGTNRLEVLLFSLGKDLDTGRDETFGINVFKVREVMHIPPVTKAPEMPASVEGMVSLRGNMVPVINLAKFCGLNVEEPPKILIITEYNKNIQGFLVHSVDNIQRLAWGDVKAPPELISQSMGGLVTALTELEDQRLVMIMDVEKVLADTADMYNDDTAFEDIPDLGEHNITLLYADDSSVARGQIQRVLDHMNIKSISNINGAEAWKRLQALATQAEAEGKHVKDYIDAVLTDVEMPEMDGYVLTRKIKDDPRFKGLPVIMHSSLSADANKNLGESVGADAYVSKFQPDELSSTIRRLALGEIEQGD